MNANMIEIDHVSKEYRLGVIGSTTLNAELQSKIARLRGREDPNVKIGTASVGSKNERFLALNDVSFQARRGEAIGIIGHNGAGKSTLLKLISRVTAPSAGEIRLAGRVASMLEVGTGFHPELTGRENVYLNGAILGMSKQEISRKFDQIVEFAEIAQFIDTPVKRYSSGMYVKLAFSVAAHLDSEILIMDEVLAVGDAKFQNKCLSKMSDEATNNHRTIMYVSHNMSTIQRLCSRVIILDHGKVTYDGDTDGGVARYLAVARDSTVKSDLTKEERSKYCRRGASLLFAWYPQRTDNHFQQGEKVRFCLRWQTSEALENLVLRICINYVTGTPVGFTTIPLGNCPSDRTYETTVEFDPSTVIPGSYFFSCEFHEIDSSGANTWHDRVKNVLQFEIEGNTKELITNQDFTSRVAWNHNAWGSVRLPSVMISNTEK